MNPQDELEPTNMENIAAKLQDDFEAKINDAIDILHKLRDNGVYGAMTVINDYLDAECVKMMFKQLAWAVERDCNRNRDNEEVDRIYARMNFNNC